MKRKVPLVLSLCALCACLVSCPPPGGTTADPFVSETLTTRLLPAPYVIDTSATGAFGLNGTTWYIDGTNGSDSNPGTSESRAFKTIQKGVDSSGPGDTIYVLEGTYRYSKNTTPDCAAIFQNHSGTSSHWILLAAAPGHHPKLEFSRCCILIGASSYLIISGFSIQGPANMITLEEAQAQGTSTSDDYYNAAGILVANDWSKPDNTTHSHHVIVVNNTVYDCSGTGIAVNESDYVTVRSNIVAKNAFWSPLGGSGISFWEAWSSNAPDTGVHNQISENVCFGNDNQVPSIPANLITDGNGIIIDCFNLSGYTGKTVVENNICFNNGARGINITRSDYLLIRNNTLFYNMFHAIGDNGDLGIFDNDNVGDLPVSDTTVASNVVSSRVAVRPGINACSIDCGSNIAGFHFARNLFNGGGFVIKINGQETPSNQTTINEVADLIDVDPLFVGASTDPTVADFSLQAGSPAINACPDGPATDFLGHPRPAGAVDMGALER